MPCPHQLSDQSDVQVPDLALDFPVLWLLVALGQSQAGSPPHHPGLHVASPVFLRQLSLFKAGDKSLLCAAPPHLTDHPHSQQDSTLALMYSPELGQKVNSPGSFQGPPAWPIPPQWGRTESGSSSTTSCSSGGPAPAPALAPRPRPGCSRGTLGEIIPPTMFILAERLKLIIDWGVQGCRGTAPLEKGLAGTASSKRPGEEGTGAR